MGKILLVSAIWLAYDAGNNLRGAHSLKLPELSLKSDLLKELRKRDVPQSSYQVIQQRNLFGLEIDSKSSPVEAKPVANQEELKLRLVGTHINQQSDIFAIVEDEKKHDQDVFEVGDEVFGRAKLLAIDKDKIRIDVNGDIIELIMEEGSSDSSGSSRSGNGSESEDTFTVSEADLNEALDNLPQLLSQARAVPYFRNGQSIGMRLFAIRKGSMYEKLGLRNGDIIMSVNENNVGDPAQALKIFEKLKSERDIELVVERAGVEKTLNYSIK